MSPAPARIVEPRPTAWTRTAAVDLFRGLGLWMVFIDHLDPNIWSYFTLWRFGFSDFAEMFVYLSGFIGIGSYQRLLQAGNTGAVVKKLLRRMRRLYIAHILSLSLSLLVIWIFARHGVQWNEWGLDAWMQDPARYAFGVLTLTRAPAMFSLLPLYVCISPILLLATIGLRRAPKLTFLISGSLWLASQIPFLDAKMSIAGWVLHPVAWQFLFVLGAGTRYYSDRIGKIARSRGILGVAAVVVAGSVLLKVLTFHQIAPLLPALLHGIPGLSVGKDHLAYYRLLHFLALAVVVCAYVRRNQGVLQTWIARLAMACGVDSLFVYSSGLVLDVGANLVLSFTHGGPWMQTQLTLCGLALLCGMAWLRQGSARHASLFSHPIKSKAVRNEPAFHPAAERAGK